MIHFQRPVIARQAFWPLTILALMALITHYKLGVQYSIGLWLLIALTAFLFRDPRRSIPPVPLAVVSPIDGTVASVEKVIDPYLDRPAIRIQLLGSITGVYTVRSVAEGKVQQQWFGTLPPKHEEGIYSATGIPEYAQWTQTDEADDIVTTMAPKFLKSGLRCNTSSGERIGQGKACAFVPFGVDAEVLLAENTRIDVKPGDSITAGSSVIATLVH